MFSADAKDEIARARFERTCCPAAFLRSLAAFSSRIGASRTRASIARPKKWVSVARPNTPSPSPSGPTERGAIARAALKAAKLAGVAAHASHSLGKRFHD